MATFLKSLNTSLIDFIQAQHIFFVATAAPDGRINLSPKGRDSLRIIGKNTVVWLNYTGSGNETAVHLLAQNRITLMFCSYGPKPLILRLYGSAKVFHTHDWQKNIDQFQKIAGVRNIFIVNIDSVQTFCRYSVPRYDFKNQRERVLEWGDRKDQNEINTYWREKNMISIDGLPTGLEKENETA